jgi:hypothetical protein
VLCVCVVCVCVCVCVRARACACGKQLVDLPSLPRALQEQLCNLDDDTRALTAAEPHALTAAEPHALTAAEPHALAVSASSEDSNEQYGDASGKKEQSATPGSICLRPHALVA